jgi:hypothetical protein
MNPDPALFELPKGFREAPQELSSQMIKAFTQMIRILVPSINQQNSQPDSQK